MFTVTSLNCVFTSFTDATLIVKLTEISCSPVRLTKLVWIERASEVKESLA